MDTEATRPPVPYADWPIFPFEGDVRTKTIQPRLDADPPRSGEPGGRPCESCAADDDSYIWVDEHWRVRQGEYPVGVPVQVFLEAREHVDLDDLDDERAGELGKLIVRLDRAIQSVGDIGRVHVNRWGDGGSHLHLWFFGRPSGVWQMMGFFMPIWAKIYAPTPPEVWRRNLITVANYLARQGGTTKISD